VHDLINTAPILHVSFNDPLQPFPVMLPMLGCTGSFSSPSSGPESHSHIYLHGYITARLFKQGSAATTLSNGSEDDGLPITVSATHLDGLVLALTPMHHSCNYRSAVAYGHATLVEDEAERLYATEVITDNMLPGRWSNSRVPPTKAEMASTGVLRVKIQSASAKIRQGGPKEDRDDLKDEGVRGKVWAGVVPGWYMWGEAVESEENKVEEVPAYVEEWRVRVNNERKTQAYRALEPPKE
jgi:hypothetical protein